MKNQDYQPLDLELLKSKNCKVITTKEALKDVTPIDWGDEVLNGETKVIITNR